MFPRKTISGMEENPVRVLGNTPLGKNRSLYPFVKLIAIPHLCYFVKRHKYIYPYYNITNPTRIFRQNDNRYFPIYQKRLDNFLE